MGPWVTPAADSKHESFRGLLESGIRLLRVVLAASSALAVASMAFWCRGISVAQKPPTTEPSRLDRFSPYLLSAVLMVVVGVLTIPRLDGSLWWDELSTLTRVVNRGPLVILTYSCNANNHVLNSGLVWVCIKVLGESELAIHLTPFLFVSAAVQSCYWTLRRLATPRVAFLAALFAATHPWLANHGVEARGYAGAILFSWVATAAFAHALSRGTPRVTGVYVASCVVAFGFISTTIFVPLGHGIAAMVVFGASYRFADLAEYRRNARNLIPACLWVGALSLLGFGILLPQTLAYSQSGAARDHITLSPELAEGLLTYTTGTAELASAGAAAGLAASGWSVAFRGRYSPQTRWLAVSVSAPLGVALCYLLLPGTRISPRFLCFLILPTCCGLGLGVDWLLRGPVGLRLIAALAVVGWGGAVAVEHHSLLTVGRPGLKALAAELRGSPVALMGAQADMNVYYFPDATVLRHDGGGDELRVSISRAQYVIEGRALWDNRLDVANPELTALGFRKREVLVCCIRGDTEYILYERSPPTQ